MLLVARCGRNPSSFRAATSTRRGPSVNDRRASVLTMNSTVSLRGEDVGLATTVQVMTVPIDLPMFVLDKVLLGVETALLELGATAIWIAPDRPQLVVMATLPPGAASKPSTAGMETN